MNDKEHKELLETVKVYTKKLLLSKKECEAFLIRSGIYDNNGKISKNYLSLK